MNVRRRIGWLLPLAVLVAAACSESPTSPKSQQVAAPSFALTGSAWSASGPGAVTLLSDGTSTDAGMSYALSGPAVWSTQTWTFQTTAASAGSYTINYKYSGFHAWFMVRAFLHPFIVHASVKTYLTGINAGPASCCSGPPSGGFNYTGATTFTVAAGDTYGFEMGGSNGDSDWRLLGTLQFYSPDNTPPVIAPVVTGTLGNNGWYTSDVNISWNVTDAESAITSAPCAATSVTADTNGATATCSATSAGGTSSASVTVTRDATAPVVAYAGNGGSYAVNQNVAITCSATDATSGIASDTCANASGQAYTFGVGSHTLSATAADNAGNTGAASTTFTVTVDAGSLCSLVNQWVSQKGVANSLCVKLNQKSAGSFNNEVRAQTGKFVPADKAAILISLATSLLGA